MEGLIGLVGLIVFFLWTSFNEIQQDKAVQDAVKAALEEGK